ncbi:MAG: 50S ribosomal protein L15 [Rhizobiaceae bacterium]
MKLNQLSDIAGSTKSRKRVGRGIGSGMGKTGGRGVKGQKSRSGVAINGFEGGQMPIYRRLPKRGFSNAMFARKLNIVSLARLQIAIDAKKLDAKKPITVATLVEAGILRRAKDGVRILSDGDIKAKLTCEVAGASKLAIEKIEKAGGSVSVGILSKKAAAEAAAAEKADKKADKADKADKSDKA